jgi:putative ABC transport system substrate-binding protein
MRRRIRDLKRREFITLFGSTIVATPRAAIAQSNQIKRLGVLSSFGEHDPQGQAEIKALQQALHELGWTSGRNMHVEYRWFANQVDRAATFSKELVSLQPDAILARATPGIIALARETKTIPTVFVSVSDPVGQGLVSNLAKPGGNITGFTAFEFSMGGKLLQTLKQIAPAVKQVAVVYNPKTAPYFQSFLQAIEPAGAASAVAPTATPVHSVAELDSAIISAGQRMPESGLIFISDGFTTTHRKRIIALTSERRVPAIYAFRAFVLDGGLVAYGIDTTDLFRRAATYLDRVLRGTKPGELPIQQPTKFDLAINLKTARAIGLDVPPTLLAVANEVIE